MSVRPTSSVLALTSVLHSPTDSPVLLTLTTAISMTREFLGSRPVVSTSKHAKTVPVIGLQIPVKMNGLLGRQASRDRSLPVRQRGSS